VLAAGLTLAACSMALPTLEKAPRAAVIARWPVIPPDAKFGQVSAVDVDARGRVYVLHRAGRAWSEPFPAEPIAEPTVFVFDGASGRLLSRWGAGQFIMPHGLSIDPQGKVWITDVGREQVFRFSPEGRPELTLGERGATGDDARHFGRPTDIAFADGEVFVSDGYRNHRVAVFDRHGRFLRQWGEQGGGERGLDIPHAIAIGGGRAYVADRENARIQVTTLDGELLGNWASGPAKGHPYSLGLLADGRLVSIEGRDGFDRSGATIRIWRPDGTVERSLDIALPGSQASLGHDIALGRDGAVYAADVYGNRVVKFALNPPGTR
jgi:peptidylamidoglycolate lyase